MFSVFIKYIELKSKSWLETYTHTLAMGWFLILHCFNSSCAICSDVGINFITPEENTFEKY